MRTPSSLQAQLLSLVIRERSGREIARAFERAFGRAVSYGTLYTTLRRMKDEGWIACRDDQDADGRVRYFQIRALGSKALARSIETSEDLMGRLRLTGGLEG